MKLIIVLVLLVSVSIFLWKWLLKPEEKAQTSKWVRRAVWAFIVAAIFVIAAFATASINSWRIW